MRAAPWLLALALFAIANGSRAATTDPPQTPERTVQAALSAVERGAFDEAVDGLELLADQGFVHPDASYDRAYVYVQRARSRSRRPGDLGRAVAALEEARALRGDDPQIDSALEAIRAEISRLRARQGNSPVVQRPSLPRAITALLPENVWAVTTALGSGLITTGLLLYLWVKRRSAEIAGATAIAVGVVLGALGGVLTIAARHFRTTTHPAVIVVSEARLLDESGRALAVRAPAPSAVPEGALVYVHGEKDGRAQIEWGTTNAWVDGASLRVLAQPPRAP